jgi:hypothetical protein
MGKSRKAYSAVEREAYVRHQLTRKQKKSTKAVPTAKEMEERHKEYLRAVKAKQAEEERTERLLEAIMKRRQEEAEEEMSRRLESRQLKSVASIRPSTVVTESAYAKEFAAKEAAKEVEREARRVRAAAALNREREEIVKKKRKKETRRLASRLGLEYINYNDLQSKYYNEEISKGASPKTATLKSSSRAYTNSDPSYRFLSNTSKPIGSWADLLNIEDELYPEKRKSILHQAAKKYIPPVSSAPVPVVPLKKSAANVILPIPVSANRLERVGGDFVKLAVRNLPIDITMKKLYSKFGSKHIFPDKAVDEKLIVKMKLPTTGVPVTKKGRTVIEQIPRGFAFLTYVNHESAQRVLDYHREHPIMFNHKNLDPPTELAVLIEPSYTVDTEPLSAIVEED